MIYSASWRPSTSIDNLLKRNVIITQIREFFKHRGLLEVETPVMSKNTVTDIYLVPFQTYFINSGEISDRTPLYLITSPEYHMKRLLAAGSGPIFQICHSFRNKEIGRYHNPEFTILEWYRPNYDMNHMINEVNDLLQHIFNCDSMEKFSYQEAFNLHVGIDPLSADKAQLYDIIIKFDLGEAISENNDDRDILLQLLFAVMVVPNIGHNKPTVIYHFPASQAALAEINLIDHRVADRFEVYFKGIELANGFRELTDACKQRQRFEQDNIKRVSMNLREYPIDENLIAALSQGMPECSGVALGVDRLVMLALKANSLSDVIAFPIDRA